MRTPLPLCAIALSLIAVQPTFAAEHVDGSGTVPGTYTLLTVAGSGSALASNTVLQTPPSLRLRVFAVSAARLSEARKAMHSLTDLSWQHLSAPSSMLEQLPVVASMRRRAGERWNTTDTSRPSDFALCYRFSRVMGLQVVPGDLTPAKLPTPKMVSVKQLHSGMGVLVGMTFRLGRTSK